MNRAFLIILVPFIVVTIFWLTLGWGWHAGLMGGCLEIAISVAVAIFISRRQAVRPNSGSGDSSASR
jgi:hypothetical protein